MTGSTDTGKTILGECTKSLKRSVLELGGNDHMVVFADANLDKAVKDVVENLLYNQG